MRLSQTFSEPSAAPAAEQTVGREGEKDSQCCAGTGRPAGWEGFRDIKDKRSSKREKGRMHVGKVNQGQDGRAGGEVVSE